MLHYRKLTANIMNRPISGYGLGGKTLATICQPGQPTLLVFLPQLGSVFARQAVMDMLTATKRDPNYPQVLFFHHDNLATGKSFFADHWPRAAAVADPDLFFYREFGIPVGGLIERAHPLSLASGVRALLKGNLPRRPSSDPWTLQGTFIVLGDRILWSHDSRYTGHFPKFRGMRQLADALHAQAKNTGSKKQPARDVLPRAG